MRTIFLVAMFATLLSTQAIAQFKYETEKVSAIRWTPTPSSVRGLSTIKVSLDGNWHFSPAPEKNFYQNKNRVGWKNIEVPGEWVMQGHTVKPGIFAGYSKLVDIPSEWKGQRIILKCEAIYSECNIWVNGKPAGNHLGGMTPFEMDITELVKSNENNISIAVRSESVADTLSSASQYAVHQLGGITRPIYLMAIPEVNVASFHVNTVFDKLYEDATLQTHLKIANETQSGQKVKIKLSLRDMAGKIVPMSNNNEHEVLLPPNSITTEKVNLTVAKPKKWDPEHPNLYTLECSISNNGKELTTVNRRFGFRQIEVRGNQLFVNNCPIKLKGICRHETHPLRGRSLVGNQWYDDVKIFKEGNVNYIRTSHYPPNEKLLDACDELGMFVEVEAPFCWASKKPINNDNYFDGILLPTLEMIERDKSHPSVILWSLANESYDFEELFKISADLVKEADPSRPRVFSQYGEDSDGGYLEIGNHHYPGPSGPEKYKNNRRPITFDEFCHLNAYNRHELMSDPGVRDFWGDILLRMWEGMYHAKGVLGGALWAGIDDSFFLPDGYVVGYGTWGPIDGWRRPKPEYWHMKKAFSPVKISLLEGQLNELATLEIENRYFFSNLNECSIVWNNSETQSGTINPDIKAGKKAQVKLPITNSALKKLNIDVFNKSEVPVDQYVFDFTKPLITGVSSPTEVFKWSENEGSKVAQSSKMKITFNNETLKISDYKGNIIVDGWPCLMLVPLNSDGDTQMTKETPEYGLFSPTASNRKIESIEVSDENTSFSITLKENYMEASGRMSIKFISDGNIVLNYEYKMLADAKLRQWGVSLVLNESINTLKWKRKGLWSVYPNDHIGRNEGTAKLFSSHPYSGLAGPSKKPEWGYHLDQTQFGSNDFRSTKRNIIEASLQGDNKSGLKVISDGMHHTRCWHNNNTTHWLIGKYDNPGSERFLRNFVEHAQKFDIPLKQGETINDKIYLRILNEK